MDLSLSAEEAAFAEEVRDWLADHLPGRPGRFADPDEEVEWGRRWQATMAVDHMVAISWPEAVGG